MKEVIFVRKNIEKWKAAQETIESIDSKTHQEITDTYLEVSADLSYALTHYPKSDLVPMLNNLAQRLHNQIYGSRPQRWSRIWHFWADEVPTEVYRHRYALSLSLLIFLLSVLLGIVSTLAEPEFANDVMGEYYIRRTLQNIEAGNPMGIYGQSSSSEMMLSITFNNIGVSFIQYISGLLTFFYSIYILLSNGTMLGSFMTFFYQHNLLSECLLAVWMHGVFEITAIIVAGGAGLVLGSGWLLPGSLPRLTAFRLAARSSVKIIIGLIPVFVAAGFIESFVTRHTQVSDPLRLGFILTCMTLMLLYFVYLPYRHRHDTTSE